MKIADHHALFLADGELNKKGIAVAAHTVMAPLMKRIGKTATATGPHAGMAVPSLGKDKS